MIYQASDLTILNKIHNLGLTEKRIEHMVMSAKLAEDLCDRYNLEDRENLVRICFLHDIRRDSSYHENKILAHDSGWNILDTEYNNPVLLHSPAGAFFLLKNAFFSNKEFKYADAIRKHTLWTEPESFELSFLRLCDISEYSRQFSEAGFLRETAFRDLEKAFKISEEVRKGFR